MVVAITTTMRVKNPTAEAVRTLLIEKFDKSIATSSPPS
jgi:hypothetical protein